MSRVKEPIYPVNITGIVAYSTAVHRKPKKSRLGHNRVKYLTHTVKVIPPSMRQDKIFIIQMGLTAVILIRTPLEIFLMN